MMPLAIQGVAPGTTVQSTNASSSPAGEPPFHRRTVGAAPPRPAIWASNAAAVPTMAPHDADYIPEKSGALPPSLAAVATGRRFAQPRSPVRAWSMRQPAGLRHTAAGNCASPWVPGHSSPLTTRLRMLTTGNVHPWIERLRGGEGRQPVSGGLYLTSGAGPLDDILGMLRGRQPPNRSSPPGPVPGQTLASHNSAANMFAIGRVSLHRSRPGGTHDAAVGSTAGAAFAQRRLAQAEATATSDSSLETDSSPGESCSTPHGAALRQPRRLKGKDNVRPTETYAATKARADIDLCARKAWSQTNMAATLDVETARMLAASTMSEDQPPSQPEEIRQREATGKFKPGSQQLACESTLESQSHSSQPVLVEQLLGRPPSEQCSLWSLVRPTIVVTEESDDVAEDSDCPTDPVSGSDGGEGTGENPGQLFTQAGSKPKCEENSLATLASATLEAASPRVILEVATAAASMVASVLHENPAAATAAAVATTASVEMKQRSPKTAAEAAASAASAVIALTTRLTMPLLLPPEELMGQTQSRSGSFSINAEAATGALCSTPADDVTQFANSEPSSSGKPPQAPPGKKRAGAVAGDPPGKTDSLARHNAMKQRLLGMQQREAQLELANLQSNAAAAQTLWGLRDSCRGGKCPVDFGRGFDGLTHMQLSGATGPANAMSYLYQFCRPLGVELQRYQATFTACDLDLDGLLTSAQLKKAIRVLNANHISAKETEYVVAILGIVDQDASPRPQEARRTVPAVATRTTTFEEFSVVAALSERVIALGSTLRDCIMTLDIARLEDRYLQVLDLFQTNDMDSSDVGFSRRLNAQYL
jgi:hypothetical protein